MVAAGAHGPHGEGPYAVGTAHIELLAVGRHRGIAVAPHHARVHMAHQPAVLGEPPRLHELGLELEKLGIRILEQLLALRVPAAAGGGIAQRQQVAGLAHRGLPPQGAAAGGAGVGVDILHLGHELVAHGVLQVAVGAENGVEGGRGLAHVLEREDQRRELMAHRGRGLQRVGPLARNDVTLEIIGPTDDVGRALEHGGERGHVVGARHTPPQAAADGLGPGHHEGGKLQRSVEAVLVAVEARRGALAAVGRLPLVVALDLDVEQLAAVEGIALGEAQHHARAQAVVGLAREVSLEVNVVGLVEHAVEPQVERVAAARGVARREREVDHAEQARRRELTEAALVVVVAVEAAREEAHGAEDDRRAHGRAAAVEAHGETAAANGVVQLFHELSPHVDAHVAHVPLAAGRGRNVGRRPEAQLHAAGGRHGVGQVRGVGRLVVEEAVVAQQGADARALALEGAHVEGVAGPQAGFGAGGLHQAVGRGREVLVAQGVDGEEVARVHRVGNLGLAGVLAHDNLVGDAASKVAVGPQHLGAHRGPQRGVDPAHEHRPRAEGADKPLGKEAVAVVKGVPYPQAHGERRAHTAAAEEGAVGRGGQGGLEFLLRGGEVRAALGGVVGDGREAGVEPVALGDAARRRTGGQHEGRGGRQHEGGERGEGSLVHRCGSWVAGAAPWRAAARRAAAAARRTAMESRRAGAESRRTVSGGRETDLSSRKRNRSLKCLSLRFHRNPPPKRLTLPSSQS